MMWREGAAAGRRRPARSFAIAPRPPARLAASWRTRAAGARMTISFYFFLSCRASLRECTLVCPLTLGHRHPFCVPQSHKAVWRPPRT